MFRAEKKDKVTAMIKLLSLNLERLRMCICLGQEYKWREGIQSTVYEFPRESSQEGAWSGLFMCEPLGLLSCYQ